MNPPLQNVRVLIVEDDALAADELRERLQRLGAEVVGVVDEGPAAIRVATQQRPDIVLMDIQLKGGMTGIEASDEIHRSFAVPVLFLTAKSDREMVLRASASDPFGCILKPCHEPELVATMQIALRRHRLERQLKESEHRYEATLASIREGVIATDPNGLITFMNPVAANLTGWSLGEAQGCPVRQVFHVVGDERTGWMPAGGSHEETSLLEVRYLLITRSGEQLPVDVTSAPIFLNGDRKTQLGKVIAFRDATERERAMERLAASESRYHSLFDQMDEGVAINQAVFDEHGDVVDYVILDVNAAFERHSPYTVKEALGRRATDLYGMDTEFIRAWWKSSASLQRPVHSDMYHQPSNRWFHVVATQLVEGRFATIFVNITDRKRAEESLREKSDEMERFFDGVIDLLSVLDVSGHFRKINREWERVLGYRIEDVVGTLYMDLVHPADRKATLAALNDLLAQRTIIDFSNRYRSKDGSWRWLEWRAVPHGEFVYASARDITDRKGAEEALRASEARYRAVVEDQAELIVRWRPDGTRTFVNEAYVRYFGGTREALIGSSFLSLIESDGERETLRKRVEQLTPEAPITLNQRLAPRADGQLRWQEWTHRGLFDRAGKLVELQSVGRDVHDRMMIEQNLQENRVLLKTMVEETPAAVAMLDTDMRYLAWSRRWLQDYRLTDHDLSGMSHYEVFPEIGEEWKAVHQRCLKGATESREDDAFPRADGSMDYVRWVCKPWHRSGDGERIGGLIMFTEVITSRKESEAALRRSEEERLKLEAQVLHTQKMEAVGRLAAGVAHDFNNLLTVIQGCSELLLADGLSDTNHQLASEIHAAGIRASRLTGQLLAFSRQQVMRLAVVDLGALIDNIARMLERLIGEDVVLTWRSVSGLWSIRVDPGQVEQVLLNLAVNARDAMPHGGQLVIDASNRDLKKAFVDNGFRLEPGRWVQLTVRDTGIGMDQATQQRIFEPFFTTKEQGKGTGLGLATVYGIVKQSGGLVRVSSVVGQGTTFELYFPAADSSANEMRAEAIELAPHGKETILVVEDDHAVRSVLVTTLRRYGYTVHETASVDDALRLLGELGDAIQLVVTDVVMPGRSGRELADHVRIQRPELPVLFVSGYADDPALRRLLEQGGVRFLPKPFTSTELARSVRAALEGTPVTQVSGVSGRRKAPNEFL